MTGSRRLDVETDEWVGDLLDGDWWPLVVDRRNQHTVMMEEVVQPYLQAMMDFHSMVRRYVRE